MSVQHKDWEEIAEQLGDRVKKARDHAKYDVKTLASLARCSPSTIHNIENGEVVPYYRTLCKIAWALHGKVSDLVELPYSLRLKFPNGLTVTPGPKRPRKPKRK